MGHPIDLHSHTRCSDGLLSPSELVAKAVDEGIEVLAVTDHDTLAGLGEAQSAAAQTTVRIVSGIELSVTHAEKDFHVLGLFVDPADTGLGDVLVNRQSDRVARAREILDKLEQLGIAIPFDEIVALSGNGSLGRPHIARALVQRGAVGSIQEAFDRYLANGQAAYVPFPRLASDEGIAAVHTAGGIASLAHPGIDDGDAMLESFVEAGIDAVEAYHASHDAAQMAHFCRRADELDLLVSGGSDFHGTGSKHALTLGQPGCPPEAFAALEAKAADYR